MELKRYNGYGQEHQGGTLVQFADVLQLQKNWQRVTSAMCAMLGELHRDGFVFNEDAPLDEEVKRWLDGRERERTEYTADPEKEWQTFWRDIVAPGGTLDLEQVKKELCDLSMLLHFVPRVYSHVTGGHISYPNTRPSAVCSAHDNYVQDLNEELIAEASTDALDNAKAIVMQHHAGAIDGYRWLLERICDELEALKPTADINMAAVASPMPAPQSVFDEIVAGTYQHRAPVDEAGRNLPADCGKDLLAGKNGERLLESVAEFRASQQAAPQDPEALPERVTDAMVYAFHRATTDGPLGEADFNEIRDALHAALRAAQPSDSAETREPLTNEQAKAIGIKYGLIVEDDGRRWVANLPMGALLNTIRAMFDYPEIAHAAVVAAPAETRASDMGQDDASPDCPHDTCNYRDGCACKPGDCAVPRPETREDTSKPISDELIEHEAGVFGHYNGGQWVFEEYQLLEFARSVAAMSREQQGGRNV